MVETGRALVVLATVAVLAITTAILLLPRPGPTGAVLSRSSRRLRPEKRSPSW